MAHEMSVLGIDIAKLVFHVVGMDDTGRVVLRKRIAHSELLAFMTPTSCRLRTAHPPQPALRGTGLARVAKNICH